VTEEWGSARAIECTAYFQPAACLGQQDPGSGPVLYIYGVKIFKFYEHPKIRPQIEVH